MKKLAKRGLKLLLGALLIALGVILLFLPGPGLLAIVAGLAVLAQDYPWAKNILNKGKEKLIAWRKKLKS